MTSLTISRRSFVIGGASAVALIGIGGLTRYAWAVDTKQILRPPGGQNEEHFLSACIRCDRCRQVCPMHIIESASMEDGFIHVRTPKLSFRKHALQRTLGTTKYHETNSGYCNFCNPNHKGNAVKQCIANCPTGALQPFDETKECIGKAVIDPVYCINYPQLGQTPTGCRLCVDACPYEAIIMNSEQRPQVVTDKCNGCGRCEAICPSASYRQFIGIGVLEEQVKAGNAVYENACTYYRRTGNIPRGINIIRED